MTFALPVGRDLVGVRRSSVAEDRAELAAEALLIELERCLTLSVEAEIRTYLHIDLSEEKVHA